MIIYLIQNRQNGKCYIGQTIGGLRERWLKHISEARLGRRTAICSAIRKYGNDAFEVKEIASAKNINELNFLEVVYIQSFNAMRPNGYNLQPGGGNHHAHVETKEKCRLASLGNKYTLGFRPTEETRRKLSEMRTGKKLHPHTEETKARLSELARLRKPQTMLGKNHTDATKALISLNRRQYKISDEEVRELFTEGETCRNIAQKVGCHYGTIYLRLRKMGAKMRESKPRGEILCPGC